MIEMKREIPIGVSDCLLGNDVRFDGDRRGFALIYDQLKAYLTLRTVPAEVTVGLNDIAQVEDFSTLCGLILCEAQPRESVQQLIQAMPWLPVEEAGQLQQPLIRQHLITRICALWELNQILVDGLTRGALIHYHSRYKLILLAHSQPEDRKIGPFVAAIDKLPIQDFFLAYRIQLMSLLSIPATRQNHTNVLQHVQGYFRPYLTSIQRQELAGLIDQYRQGLQSLQAPMALLKHYLAEYPDAYLQQQRYFDPYPEALNLSYGI